MEIKISGAVVPQQAQTDDAGYDLVSTESVSIGPGARALVKTGIKVAIPPGHAGLVCSRSGMALRHGVFVLNAPGVIDPGYRGEVGVVLFNGGDRFFDIAVGDRIAQLLFVRVEHPEMRFVVFDAADSSRGVGGFGSTNGFGVA